MMLPSERRREFTRKELIMSQFIRRSSSLADVNFSQALHSETRAPLEGAEGHGCPNEWSCDSQCRAMGYRGGYCDFWTFRMVCRCY